MEAIIYGDLDTEMTIMAKGHPLLAKHIGETAAIFEKNEGAKPSLEFRKGAILAYRALLKEAESRGGKLPKLSNRAFQSRATDFLNVEGDRKAAEELADAINTGGDLTHFSRENPGTIDNLRHGHAKTMASALKGENAMSMVLRMYQKAEDDTVFIFRWMGVAEVFTLFKKNVELKQLKAIRNFPQV